MGPYSHPHDGEDTTHATAELVSADTPIVSVLITTRDRPLQLVEAVRSVLANTVRTIEVLVVDQSDTSQSKALLQTRFSGDSRIRYIADDGRGISHGRNVGLAQARADLIAITDDDCLVTPTWIARLLAACAQFPEAMLIFGTVGAPPHNYRKQVVPVEMLTERRIEYGLVGHAARLEGIGAHMALRRELIERIGAFDPRFGSGGERWSGEDYELHYRALCAGCGVLVEPEIVVTHLGFRPIADAWDLWRRDALGNGALTARLVRDGRHGAAWRFWWWNVGRVLANAFFHTIFFQYPTGTRLAYWMIGHSLRGFVKEWREPGAQVTPCAGSAPSGLDCAAV
ncbi:MAG TPA: glycosyltransferase [Ktedonobacterales bacterium]|nr:glycosyltransferase [Ktedonobacterales bacterium]